MVGLDLEQAGFHRRSTAEPPWQAGQSQHQFALDSRLGSPTGEG
jgi:hypothetical protein